MAPFFSIIIPVYNIERYIEMCLDSVLCQEEDDYEIIAVIDGSRDSSCEICERKAKTDLRVRVIIQENQGLSEARNTGINCAEGRYLLFLDGDDMLAEHALANCRYVLEKANYPDMMVNRAIYIDVEGNPRGRSAEFPPNIGSLSVLEQYKACFIDGKLQPWAWVNLYKRSYIIENDFRFKKGLLHEDELWTPNVFLRCKKLVFYSGDLVMYRLARGGSISNHITFRNIKAKLEIIDLLQGLFKADSDEKRLLKMRSAGIYWGVLNDIAKYNIEYKDFLVELKQKRKYLYYSKKHKVLYYIVSWLGIDATISLLRKVKK